jgi:hypothetical protein
MRKKCILHVKISLRLSLCVLASYLAVGQELVPGKLVVPSELADKPANAATEGIWSGNEEWIQAYSASQFAPLVQGGYVTGISFRAEEGRVLGFDVTYSHFEVQLATLKKPIGEVDLDFIPGRYADTTLVFARDNVHLIGASSTSPAIPAPFEITIPFDTPFPYNSTAGNLLIHLRSGPVTTAISTRVDLIGGTLTPLPISYVVAHPGPFAGPEVSYGGMPTQFTFQAVPEPSAVSLFTLVFFGCITYYVINRRSYTIVYPPRFWRNHLNRSGFLSGPIIVQETGPWKTLTTVQRV